MCKKINWISTSDVIYSGSATGCKHLPDEIMCCSPPWSIPPDIGGEAEQQVGEAPPCDEPGGGDGKWLKLDKIIGETFQKVMCRCPTTKNVEFLTSVAADSKDQEKMVKDLIMHSLEYLARKDAGKKDCTLPASSSSSSSSEDSASGSGAAG